MKKKIHKDALLTIQPVEDLYSQVGPAEEIVYKLRNSIVPNVLEKFKEEAEEIKDNLGEQQYSFMAFAAFTDLFFRCLGAQLDGNPTFFLDYAHELCQAAANEMKQREFALVAELDAITSKLEESNK